MHSIIAIVSCKIATFSCAYEWHIYVYLCKYIRIFTYVFMYSYSGEITKKFALSCIRNMQHVTGTSLLVHMSRHYCLCAAVCCSVLQYVAVCSSTLLYVAVCCSMLRCVAVCCRVLQCVAGCSAHCNILQHAEISWFFTMLSGKISTPWCCMLRTATYCNMLQ